VSELLRPFAEHRRIAWTLALVLFGTYAYFVPAPAWNQNSRFALTRALVERQSTIIDPDHETTGDKSFRDGHFYCDKAPGASVLAALPYAIAYGIGRIVGADPPEVTVIPLDPRDVAAGRTPTPEERKPGDRLQYNRSHRLGLYLAGLFSVGLVSVLGTLALWLLVVRRYGVAIASACALTYGLATPALPYSTALYGHQLCGALLSIAFVGTVATESTTSRIGVVVGLAAGYAVATEYTAVVPAALVALLYLRRHGLRACGPLALGALPSVVLLAVYHTVAFGHPLSTGYDWVWLPEFAEGMRVRYGIGRPSGGVLLAILFGSYRGLFYLAPVLLLAAWGLVREAWRPTLVDREAMLVAIACCAWFLLLNAGYYMWDGGASIGPRHVVPMLGLLALGLPIARRTVPSAFAVLAIVSAAQLLIATAAMPEAPQFGDPLWEFALGQVLGRPASTDAIASNLGLLLGLPSIVSLAPLLVLWAWALPIAKNDA
jgi:hypothetical protein